MLKNIRPLERSPPFFLLLTLYLVFQVVKLADLGKRNVEARTAFVRGGEERTANDRFCLFSRDGNGTRRVESNEKYRRRAKFGGERREREREDDSHASARTRMEDRAQGIGVAVEEGQLASEERPRLFPVRRRGP